jgi:hypothetical protein
LFAPERLYLRRAEKARGGVVQNMIAFEAEGFETLSNLPQAWAGALAKSIVYATCAMRRAAQLAQGIDGSVSEVDGSIPVCSFQPTFSG